MKQRPRIYYSDSQKALMWERWRQGATLHEIAGLFDRGHSSIHRILYETGGIRPQQRHRSSRALSLAEREEISRAAVAGQSIRTIAARLGRAPSTVSREVQRNGGRASYRANLADQAAWDRAHRPKQCKLVENRGLARTVSDKLRLQWSPEQIAGSSQTPPSWPRRSMTLRQEWRSCPRNWPGAPWTTPTSTRCLKRRRTSHWVRAGGRSFLCVGTTRVRKSGDVAFIARECRYVLGELRGGGMRNTKASADKRTNLELRDVPGKTRDRVLADLVAHAPDIEWFQVTPEALHGLVQAVSGKAGHRS